MDRTEMAADFYKLVAHNYVVHLHLKSSCRSIGRSDILGVLSTSCNHVELLMLYIVEQRTNRCRSYRFAIMVLFNCLQSFWV